MNYMMICNKFKERQLLWAFELELAGNMLFRYLKISCLKACLDYTMSKQTNLNGDFGITQDVTQLSPRLPEFRNAFLSEYGNVNDMFEIQ